MSSAAARTLGSCSDSLSARIELQMLAQTWVAFVIRNKQGQVSPCLCIVSQPRKTEVGSVVCLDIVPLPDTQNSDAAIPLCRVSEKFEGD